MTDNSFLYNYSFPFNVIEHPTKGTVVLYRFLEKVLFIADSNSSARLEDETQEEYRLRRFLVKEKIKHHKKGRVVWPSLNVPDLMKKKLDTSLGTYDKKKVQAKIDEMIAKIDEQEKEKLSGIQEEMEKATVDADAYEAGVKAAEELINEINKKGE